MAKEEDKLNAKEAKARAKAEKRLVRGSLSLAECS